MEEYNSPVSFYEWLKLRRKALDMTQEDVAQRVGCSIGTIRKIESGERRPSKQLAGLLAKALEVPDEDQPTFIRIARGELNIERLRKPAIDHIPSLLEISNLQYVRQGDPPITITKSTLPTNRIPLQATPLIGREADLAALEKLFNDPQCRLITLTGVGGIGKTRLAIEFASRNQPAFPGGVYYIPLTAVNSPEKIIPAIADVLDFGFSGTTDPKEQLLNYLSSNIQQTGLFIFDNLEHLLTHSSAQNNTYGLVELVAEILTRLPAVKILGTSRERLNLHGEWTYELHGLSVPPTDFVGQLEDYDSITLFLRSARRTRVDFQVADDQQPALMRICQLVEGVPLAIELAGAWVGVLSCQEIAQEIKSNMDFLTTSMRDIPERHRSIRAVFDHSWKLLSDEERWVLCQLSVFQGGFDRDAADQVAGASLPLLASLSTKSLVRRSERGRYDLHEVIRQYALSHLKSHPRSPDTYQRHCEYYLSFLQDHETSLKSASQQEAIRQLTDVIDNIHAAWDWAINHKKFAELGQAGRAYGWYFEIAGLYREGIQQLELLLQALKNSPQVDQWQRVFGLALLHQALLYFRKGEFEHAQKLYEESALTLRPTGDQTLLMDALIFLGTILHLVGDYERAKSTLEEGLGIARLNDDRWFEAYAMCNLGYLDSLMGRYQEGCEKMLRSIDIWREIGDPHYIALGMNFLVPTLNKLGRFEEARSYMHESIALCERSKNRWGLGTAYRYLGLTYIAEGQFTQAKAHLLKSLEILDQFTEGWDIARSLTYLGDAARMSGDLIEARKFYLDALRPSIEAKAVPIALDALWGLGSLQAQSGSAEQALMLCYFIIGHPSSEQETKSRAEQLYEALETQLSPRQVKAAQAAAKQKTFDSIVNEMLGTA